MDYSNKWPLFIDPQSQASVFVKKMSIDIKMDQFKIMVANDEKLSKELEMSIKTGKWLIVENLNEKLPSDLDNILNPIIKTRGKGKVIKFDDREIDYDDEFKLSYFRSTKSTLPT